MQDVSHGRERVRSWPRKRPKALPLKTREQNEIFRQCQTASKFADPRIMIACEEATRGTPLLPRDLFTMMTLQTMFSILGEDGKTRYPLATRTAVSESLDALGNTTGMTLWRGPQFWEANLPAQQDVAGAILDRPAGHTGVAANTFTAIPFTAITVDQGPFWSAGAPANIVVPWTGWYDFAFTTLAQPGSGTYRTIALQQNGVVKARTASNDANSGIAINLTVNAPLHCTAGDIIQCIVAANVTNRVWTNTIATVVYL